MSLTPGTLSDLHAPFIYAIEGLTPRLYPGYRWKSKNRRGVEPSMNSRTFYLEWMDESTREESLFTGVTGGGYQVRQELIITVDYHIADNANNFHPMSVVADDYWQVADVLQQQKNSLSALVAVEELGKQKLDEGDDSFRVEFRFSVRYMQRRLSA